ncbi:MAG: hypothetical protein NT103_01855 [Campylobacterales bacterium]|nr:hypothetical protein [Campylobacterales bacterium]
MDSITIVRIHDDFTSITEAKNTRKKTVFSPQIHFTEPHEIANYLKSKKKIYLFFSSDNILEESIVLPSIIKNEATIRSALLAKIHDSGASPETLVLNKLYTTLDPTGESAIHRYEGLSEKEILIHIAPIPKHEYLRRISVERYALFALAQHAFKGRSYLCVYTEEKRNLIVAVDNGTLLFSRVGFMQSEDEIGQIMEQINDISRTVAYAHQQYREAKFEFIAICGNIADGEIVPMQLNASTGLGVTVLAPTLIVDGLEPNMAQNSILEIGMLFLDNTMNFLPNSVKAAREFYLGSAIAIVIACAFMLFGLFQSYDAYTSYQSSLDEYDAVESQLYQTLRNTDTLDDKQLQEITAQLKSSTPLHHHLLDDLILFDNVLKLIKPQGVSFTEGGELILDFKHQCKTLLELYLFEKNFRHNVDTMKDTQVIAAYKTDYNTLTFEATLKRGGVQPVSPPPRHRSGQ